MRRAARRARRAHAPNTVLWPRSVSSSDSTGSLSRRVSHQCTYPSVLTLVHSLAVLLCSHAMSYTGSRWERSMGELSHGVCPRRVSQYATWPLYMPADRAMRTTQTRR